MIVLGVCPCDTERDLNYWLEFREFLEKILREKIELKTSKSFAEESPLPRRSKASALTLPLQIWLSFSKPGAISLFVDFLQNGIILS